VLNDLLSILLDGIDRSFGFWLRHFKLGFVNEDFFILNFGLILMCLLNLIQTSTNIGNILSKDSSFWSSDHLSDFNELNKSNDSDKI
jgi:hypothetical protein